MNNCPKCGFAIDQNSFFCPMCGTEILASYNNDINDEALINSYIGKNFDKLDKSKFSIYTFLGGFLYFFYRKMWLIGFIWLTAVCAVGALVYPFHFILFLYFRIVMAIKFKEIYYKHVENQVNKIKMKNADKSKMELVAICSKKGGVSFAPVVGVILLYVIFLIFCFVMVCVLIWRFINIGGGLK